MKAKQATILRISKQLYNIKIPTALGVGIALVVLFVSVGVTVFFLTRTVDDNRLYKQGERELSNGQYAFAVKTLTKATALHPKDSRLFLALARAYVGVDQIDKAWDAISMAQQLGASVTAEPALASDLANYYRQRSQYEKAVDLLQPLAKAGIAGKKAELADLDALWGDEALRNGNLEQALRCWEEVRDLHEGSRYLEAESRLSTIYERLANTLAAKNDDTQALSYLAKLNVIAQNTKNYQMAADIYERNDQLELAIDQVRKALKIDNNATLNRKLALLLSARGKELLDKGNTDTGYAYLQQAKALDPQSSLPEATLRDLKVDFNGHFPKLIGQVWNAGQRTINALLMKVELRDSNGNTLWEQEQKIVDEFVPPLNSHESKSFEFAANVPLKTNEQAEFRVFLDGTLYKSYPIDSQSTMRSKTEQNSNTELNPSSTAKFTPSIAPRITAEPKMAPLAAPIPGTMDQTPIYRPNTSAEEKTMKELDY